MKPGDPITIETTANGWLVRPAFLGEHYPLLWTELCVFQTLDYDHQGCQSEKCLAGFLIRHFSVQEERK